jgi:hypothetical protein
MGQLQWLSESHRIADEQNLPCFMISDNKEVLIAFHEDQANEGDAKKKEKTAAIWTNYGAFIRVLQTLFSKLS